MYRLLAEIAKPQGMVGEMAATHGGLSPIVRLYIYGIHGYVAEVMFTAAWEFVVNNNWKFPGCTSVWCLFIYALCGFVIEQMYLRMEGNVHILIRGMVYVIWTYTWEFTTGYVLRHFNACPWDYTPFDFDVVGLITLEYAPLWYIGTLLQEQLLTKNILLLQWNTDQQTKNLKWDYTQRKLSNGVPGAKKVD